MRGVGRFSLASSGTALHDGPIGQIQTLVNVFQRFPMAQIL
jgi:hypothetical protein